ncbi:PSD1 and planctomycete cytochrome C domain-containing protein [Thalassoglobus polymorphus]|uniref:Planctomycete cytochrome C n=1 Tax=Thalassoglobus polymorphus TaxID=2527994 RepID=A0A517QJ78_9PLAN|nr:PSD1 and planctomycete cytochrome C domain-containing protein [Thalassoglobus polymorphus]QDT31701.1 Planctomycete cytochrome C [Thalassoglobus polymorphus]
MQSFQFPRIVLIAIAVVCFCGAISFAAEELPADVHFVRHVFPTLQTKCFTCHGDDEGELRGDLNLKTQVDLLKGGESGETSVVAGKPDESLLYLAVTRNSDVVGAMPPKENDALTKQQVAAIKTWIERGAVWPSEKRIVEIRKEYQSQWDAEDGIPIQTSGGLSDDWTNRRYETENLWAYQPLWADPDGVLKAAQENSIDVLINNRLNEIGLPSSQRADRRTLIRRATYDLIGLPPTIQEIENFLNDPAEDFVAFQTVVERLLESPHYGERWGQHWLDVVRYADSSGFANDYERGNAWRYRDYVVRSFNEDKPYDQFVREQIAGDEIDPTNPENLIAVGFLRMGPWELTGMEVPKVARQRFLDDVTDIVGQTFLGHMLQCARCHDHKFDPVPTRDYYSIQAAFATTQLVERHVDFMKEENVSGFEERELLLARRKHYLAMLNDLNKKKTIQAARDWYRDEEKDSSHFEAIFNKLVEKKGGEEKVNVGEVRTAMQKAKIDPSLIPPRHVGFQPADFGKERVARKGLERLLWRLDRYDPYALSVYNGKTLQRKSVSAPVRMPKNPRGQGELEESFILTGGDPFSPSLPVTPGNLSAVSFTGSNVPRTESIYDRRLELANWIASKENPLTARVMVNRIWQGHFGQGIAGNPNNFGTTGKKPTHPKLLDYLAREFMDSGWSVKHMHRKIMASDAYCRSSKHSDTQQLNALDPLRETYAVFLPRRLEAEEIRDSMLAVSGELNPEIGGIPSRPEMNLEAALQPRQVMGTFAEGWQPSVSPEQRHRRSIYSLKIRGLGDPFMEVFNSPGSDLSCEKREASTVTPQVFALMNNEQTYARGLAMANSTLEKSPQASDSEIIQAIYQRTLGRVPVDLELNACLSHWQQMTKRHQTLEIERIEYPTEVEREAVEENTGEKFRFTEPLEFYQNFVPDLQAADVDARTRALAEVCLVLLNSNEFLYVY